MNIAILGAGAFGTALAVTLVENGPVTLWGRAMAQRFADRFSRLPGVTPPQQVISTSVLRTALDADILLLALPMQALADFLAQIDDPLTDKALVACCKGMDLASLSGPTAVIQSAKPDAVPAILSGPSFAADIAKGKPTALTLACGDPHRGSELQQRLSTRTLRLYRTTDTTGVELGGALKNVMAIACGATIGLGLGDSARAALMTRGFAEMNRIAIHLGGSPSTLAGLSGLGDLALTCTSPLSRNYRFGISLGEGSPFDPNITVEGVSTALAANGLADKLGLDLPIIRAVADITSQNLPVEAAMCSLLSRSLKEE